MSNDSHSVSILERENITIDGVIKVINFDDEEFLLDTIYGPLEIKGHNLEIVKLDTYQGTISIKGKLNSLVYQKEEGKGETGILSRLFK